MNRRFTKKNKAGIKGKSTLLTGLDKMRKIRKASGVDQRVGGQSDLDKSLNDMAKWLVAITKCPPRHYGKVWNEEKEVIVRQAQALYEEMQREGVDPDVWTMVTLAKGYGKVRSPDKAKSKNAQFHLFYRFLVFSKTPVDPD